MANKLRNITELYFDTLKDISTNQSEWLSFLECAAMNYKYSFSDQVLIYAQKPYASACAEIETWNKSLKRWVNKGATGIALLAENNGNTYLRYVFDVSDTNSKHGKNIVLWSVTKPYEEYVIEVLENRYGELDDNRLVFKAIKQLQTKYPNIHININSGDRNDILDKLDKGVKYGIGSSQSHERYEILERTLKDNETMEMEDVRDTLDSVSKDNFNEFESTEWSIVYNQTTLEVHYYHRENYDKRYTFNLN